MDHTQRPARGEKTRKKVDWLVIQIAASDVMLPISFMKHGASPCTVSRYPAA